MEVAHRRLLAGHQRGDGKLSLARRTDVQYNVAMLPALLSARTEAAYTLLRVVSGLMFGFHGLQKVLGIASEFQPPVGSQLWIGGVIELVAGPLIALGLLTPYAAFLASGTMAVAYIQFHWQGALDKGFWPALNKGELALLYSVLFLYIACRGSGRHGIDSRLNK